MASYRRLNIDKIASVLENEDDYSPHDTDSEQEDCVTQDDVPETATETSCNKPEPKKRRYCGYCSYKRRG